MKKSTVALGAAVLLAGVSASSMASAGWQAFFIENYTGDVASGTAWTQNAGNAVYVGDISRPYFDSHGSADYTIGSWLKTGGVNFTGPQAGDTLDDTLWLFYTDNHFSHAPDLTVTHDDGIAAPYGNILGTNYSGFTSGPTGAITETGTCVTCNYPGQIGIVYNETYGAPGVLEVNSVPEPSTWAMMGLGFAGLAFAGYRARRTATAIA